MCLGTSADLADVWEYVNYSDGDSDVTELGVSLNGDSDVNRLCNSIAELEQLESLQLISKGGALPSLLGLSQLHHLTKLCLDGQIAMLPLPHEFPPNISQLTLRNSFLRMPDPMCVLKQLPKLSILRLRRQSYSGHQLIISAGGFPLLKFLELERLSSEHELTRWCIAKDKTLLHFMVSRPEGSSCWNNVCNHSSGVGDLYNVNLCISITKQSQWTDGLSYWSLQGLKERDQKMAESAINYVVQNLSDLLVQKADFLKGVGVQVGWLRDELQRMQCFLKDADAKQEEEEQVHNWVTEIRNAAYDAEDIIDTFILKIESKRRHVVKRYLKSLQTLDLSNVFFAEIPNIICKMRDLRHLYMNSSDFTGKLRIDTLKNLQTLTLIHINNLELKNIGKLLNLRKLGVELDVDSNVKRFFKSIARLEQLESLQLLNVIGVFPSLLGLSRLHRLTKLCLDGQIRMLPLAQEFPPNISQLTLRNSFLGMMDPMSVLKQLPKLSILKMKTQSYQGYQMAIPAGGFPQLKFLELERFSLLQKLTIEDGAMPRIRHFRLSLCPYLLELPVGIVSATTLQELEICSMQSEFVNRLRGEDSYKVKHIPSVTFS
ncbi:hypothetical protein Dsin_014657 [Dipteronia sinensis]|uniref:Rx N-terminal domain-containing protein n=1 Tax=Dipteronia sinensis TaxID=43782 RepID=A0AAE0EAI8_9ROSI|nr:hypothetical protein Dsin_014657 [Dipteronia sinensis]